MKRGIVILMLVLGGLFSQTTDAIAGDVQIDGYYKNFFIGYDTPKITGIPDEPLRGSVTNRIRLNLAYRPCKYAVFTLAYNLAPRIQDNELFQLTGTGRPAYRAVDFDSRIYPREGEPVRSFGLFHNLDRALLTVNLPWADFYLGRQAIAWGSARSVNPTDILAPYSYDELDTEDRLGVDAVRVRMPLGFMGELDAGWVFGDDFAFDQSAMFLRGKYYLLNTDVSAMVIGFRENLLVGFDLTRSVGGASVWLEGAQVFVGALADGSRDRGLDYFRLTVGADQALSPTIYGYVEFHYSQAGDEYFQAYHSQSKNVAFTDGGVYLLGEYYLIPGVSWTITPLLTGSAQVMVDYSTQSALLSPNLEYNFAENIYLAAGAYIGIGEGPYAISRVNEPDPVYSRSEFGGYSDFYYTSFRLYF